MYDIFHIHKIIEYQPNPEHTPSVPRSSDGAISDRYMPKTAVVIPDERPTTILPSTIISTDDKIRQKKNINAPIANKIPQISNAPFLIE